MLNQIVSQGGLVPQNEVASYFGQKPEISLDDFLAAFYPDAQEPIMLRTFQAKGAPKGTTPPLNWESTREELGTDEILRKTGELNDRNGIYFIVNAGGHEDKGITRFTAFFMESDEGSLDEQHAKLDSAPLPTSIRIETKKSVHAYWLIEGNCSEEQWREGQARIIAYFGSDPSIKNPARVMRLPFFNHVTYNDVGDYSYKSVEVAQFAPSRRYTAEAMLSAFPAVVTEQKKSLSEVLRESVRSSENFAPWKELNEETKHRLLAMRPLTKSSDGEWAHVKGICHNGRGDTGIFINLNSGAYGCHRGCETADIRRALGLPKRPLNSSTSSSSQSGDEEGDFAECAAFPKLRDEALNGLAGDFVRTIYPHTEADEAALLVQLLVGFGNIMGRTAYYIADGARHYTNLYALVVGKTSAAKGSALAHVMNLLEPLDSGWTDGRIQNGLSSGEGLIKAVDEKENPQDRRLFVQETEFASVLHMNKREGNTLSSVIRNLWDKGRAGTMTKTDAVSTKDALVSIIGHITPEELERYLTPTEIANGYANRFLFSCVRRSKNLPEGGRLSVEESQRLAERFTQVMEFAQGVDEMKRDAEASNLWASVYPQLAADRPGKFGKVTARSRPQVLRLSIIYALLDRSAVVRRVHLEAALALWQFCEDSARYIFGGSILSDKAQKLLDAISALEEDGMSKTEMYALFNRRVKSTELNALLGEIESAKQAYSTKIVTEGRAEERWFMVAEDAACELSESDEESLGDENLDSSNSSNSTLRAA